MSLTHTQKTYIKKHIQRESINQISQTQNIEKKEIVDYLKKRWGEQKLKNYLAKQQNTKRQRVPLDMKENSPPSNLKDWFKLHTPSLILLLILVLITYANSLNNVFLSDDLAEIVNNPNVGNLKYAITSHPFGFIRLVLYWLAFHIGGLSASLFRSINYFFHIGTVFLIYVIFSLISSKRLAFFVAGIFAVHPAIAEAVVWISGGSYPQYTFFFLLSFFFYILSEAKNSSSAYLISKTKKKYYIFSSATFLLAFMSHPQMPAALFVVFPIWEFLFGDLKKNWLKYLPFLAITIVYILINFGSLPERETVLQTVHYQEKGIDNPFVLIPVAISSYFELIFFPKTLTLYHSELAFGTISFIIRSLLTLVFFIGILISFKKNKFIFFWSSFFLIALAPTLTPFRLNWIVAERYIYLPIIGILAVVGLGFIKLSDRLKLKHVQYLLLGLIIVLLSARTIIRNIDWKNEDNLWIATGKTSPSSPNTHNNLGDVYGRHGDKEAALKEFQTAIALKTNYADAYHNAGNTLREMGKTDQALAYYQKAAQLNPNLWQSYQNIAALYFEAGKQASSSAQALEQYNLSLENLQKAISINPKNLNLYNNLGVVYLTMGQKDKAKEVFTLVLTQDPQNQFAQVGLAQASK